MIIKRIEGVAEQKKERSLLKVEGKKESNTEFQVQNQKPHPNKPIKPSIQKKNPPENRNKDKEEERQTTITITS